MSSVPAGPAGSPTAVDLPPNVSPPPVAPNANGSALGADAAGSIGTLRTLVVHHYFPMLHHRHIHIHAARTVLRIRIARCHHGPVRPRRISRRVPRQRVRVVPCPRIRNPRLIQKSRRRAVRKRVFQRVIQRIRPRIRLVVNKRRNRLKPPAFINPRIRRLCRQPQVRRPRRRRRFRPPPPQKQPQAQSAE